MRRPTHRRSCRCESCRADPRARRLLPGGVALTPRTVATIRGDRHQDTFGAAIGVTGRTVRRMEAGDGGATLLQALAIAGAELHRGDVKAALYTLDMIGETLDLAPVWGVRTDRPERWTP